MLLCVDKGLLFCVCKGTNHLEKSTMIAILGAYVGIKVNYFSCSYKGMKGDCIDQQVGPNHPLDENINQMTVYLP